MHCHTKNALVRVGGVALAFVGFVSAGSAQSGPDYFKGKTVTYIVSTAPGGGYDTYGRLVAEFMQKYLPGSTFVVKNVPGAGDLIGANTIALSKPDGLTIGTFNTGLIYNQLIDHPGVRFDLTKMSWIGKAASDPRVVVIGQQSAIKTFEELRESKAEILFAADGIGSSSYVESVILFKALKLPGKVVTGYKGSEGELAMRRGEVQAAIASRSSWTPFVSNGYGRFIAQIGGKQNDLPQLLSLIPFPEAKTLMQLVQSQAEISRLTVGPPDIPVNILEMLRTAYKQALEDEEFIARLKKAKLPYDPAYGDVVSKLVEAALKQSPETVTLLKQAMGKPK
jgi:tripartite-type tricarboxylate transporter receptor subunit TctC